MFGSVKRTILWFEDLLVRTNHQSSVINHDMHIFSLNTVTSLLQTKRLSPLCDALL